MVNPRSGALGAPFGEYGYVFLGKCREAPLGKPVASLCVPPADVAWIVRLHWTSQWPQRYAAAFPELATQSWQPSVETGFVCGRM